MPVSINLQITKGKTEMLDSLEVPGGPQVHFLPTYHWPSYFSTLSTPHKQLLSRASAAGYKHTHAHTHKALKINVLNFIKTFSSNRLTYTENKPVIPKGEEVGGEGKIGEWD